MSNTQHTSFDTTTTATKLNTIELKSGLEEKLSYKDIKVLVADDFNTMRKVITGVLEDLGFEKISEAENGAVAFKKLTEEKDYNFLITDWNMPELSGLELVKKIRSNNDLKKIPIMMVTTESKKTDIIEAAKAGVNGYVIKPFTPEAIKEKIDKILG